MDSIPCGILVGVEERSIGSLLDLIRKYERTLVDAGVYGSQLCIEAVSLYYCLFKDGIRDEMARWLGITILTIYLQIFCRIRDM